MAAIKKYTTKKGETRYKFKVYLGMDKVTGKRVETSRQGFKKKRDAEHAYQQLNINFVNGEVNMEKINSTLPLANYSLIGLIIYTKKKLQRIRHQI